MSDELTVLGWRYEGAVATLGKDGRITVPKPIRQMMEWTPGTVLQIWIKAIVEGEPGEIWLSRGDARATGTPE